MKKTYSCRFDFYYSFGSIYGGFITAPTLKELKRLCDEKKKDNNNDEEDIEAITFGEITLTTTECLPYNIGDDIRVKKPKNKYLKATLISRNVKLSPVRI